MNKAVKHLKKDLVMLGVIDNIEPFEWDNTGDLYKDLLHAIIGQQLSVKAARTIRERVQLVLKNDYSPDNILKTKDEKLREAGMSWMKIKYFNGIAEAKKEGLLDEDKFKKMSDEEVIEELIKLKGIGKWSAEMILIFTLARQDVFSMGDLGLRNAVAMHYKVNRDDFEKIEKITKKWSPYRSLASRYLWKSLDSA